MGARAGDPATRRENARRGPLGRGDGPLHGLQIAAQELQEALGGRGHFDAVSWIELYGQLDIGLALEIRDRGVER